MPVRLRNVAAPQPGQAGYTEAVARLAELLARARAVHRVRRCAGALPATEPDGRAARVPLRPERREPERGARAAGLGRRTTRDADASALDKSFRAAQDEARAEQRALWTVRSFSARSGASARRRRRAGAGSSRAARRGICLASTAARTAQSGLGVVAAVAEAAVGRERARSRGTPRRAGRGRRGPCRSRARPACRSRRRRRAGAARSTREVVWRPRSHFALISPVSSRSSGSSAFRSDDLPTPEWPASTVVPSASARAQRVEPGAARRRDGEDRHHAPRSRAISSGSASGFSSRSSLFTTSSASSPPARAASRKRSTAPDAERRARDRGRRSRAGRRSPRSPARAAGCRRSAGARAGCGGAGSRRAPRARGSKRTSSPTASARSSCASLPVRRRRSTRSSLTTSHAPRRTVMTVPCASVMRAGGPRARDERLEDAQLAAVLERLHLGVPLQAERERAVVEHDRFDDTVRCMGGRAQAAAERAHGLVVPRADGQLALGGRARRTGRSRSIAHGVQSWAAAAAGGAAPSRRRRRAGAARDRRRARCS